MRQAIYHRMIDAAPLAMLAVDGKGVVQVANSRAEKLFEYSNDELVGCDIQVLVPDRKGYPSFLKLLSSPTRTHEGTLLENLYSVTKSGRKYPVEIHLGEINSEDASFTLVSISDLRERHKRDVLLSSYRLMVELAPTAMLLVDPKGKIDLVNAQSEILLGFLREELMGRRFERLFPSDIANRMLPYLTEIETFETRVLFDQFCLSKEQQLIPVEIMLRPMTTSHGTSVIVMLTDLRDRKRAEHQFQIIESAPNAMLILDRKNGIALVNRSTENLFGYSRDELMGKSSELIVPDGLLEPSSELAAASSMQQLPDLFGRRKDGTAVPIEIGVSTIDTSDGPTTVVSIVDVTERKRYEDELRRSNAELEQFAYLASHDLQEPLRMVASYTQLLAKRYQGNLDEKADRYIHYAVDGAKRMQQLISDLLKYSRVGSAGAPMVSVSVAAVLADVLRIFGDAIRQTGATIDQGVLPTVIGDAVQLHQLLQNLIGNALKFHGSASPHISIRAARRGDRWLFTVKDNGIGLEMRYAETVFQMFHRLHPRDHYDGSGIGLSISKRIVERHGGTIWLESEPGTGTTIFFTLASSGLSRTMTPVRPPSAL